MGIEIEQRFPHPFLMWTFYGVDCETTQNMAITLLFTSLVTKSIKLLYVANFAQFDKLDISWSRFLAQFVNDLQLIPWTDI